MCVKSIYRVIAIILTDPKFQKVACQIHNSTFQNSLFFHLITCWILTFDPFVCLFIYLFYTFYIYVYIFSVFVTFFCIFVVYLMYIYCKFHVYICCMLVVYFIYISCILVVYLLYICCIFVVEIKSYAIWLTLDIY